MLPQIEALYGGQAGGGKSDALLMAALQYVDVPGYAALLLRRTYKELSLPEALMDRAQAWLSGTDAKWHRQSYMWQFPSGATLTFGYLDNEGTELQYQSAAFQFIGFDELTQFSERLYRYMSSRLRRLKDVMIPLRMRSGTNPGGEGHEWVKARFISPRNIERPFIPATLADNPHLDADEYRKSLALLTPVERAWFEQGDWDAAPGGTIAQRGWFPIIEAAPVGGRRVRFWDFAATAMAKGKDPDWMVGTLESELAKKYTVEHVVRGRFAPGDVEKVVRNTADMDGRGITILMEQEPGSSGKLFTDRMIKVLAGYTVRAIPSTGDKIHRAMPFIAQAQAGNVQLVKGAWNSAWIDEITSVPVSAHDDQWDSAAGAFNGLTQLSGGWSRGAAG